MSLRQRFMDVMYYGREDHYPT